MNIKQIREKYKMSQAEFGKLLGVGRYVIGEIEAGRREASEKELSRLSELSTFSRKSIVPTRSKTVITPDEFSKKVFFVSMSHVLSVLSTLKREGFLNEDGIYLNQELLKIFKYD